MNVAEVMAKADSGEMLPVEEIKVDQANVKPIRHLYDKYDTLEKRYLEDKGTLWILQDIPALLHGVYCYCRRKRECQRYGVGHYKEIA